MSLKEEITSYIIESLVKVSIHDIRKLRDFYGQQLRVKQNNEGQECLILYPCIIEKMSYGEKHNHMGFYAIIPEQ